MLTKETAKGHSQTSTICRNLEFYQNDTKIRRKLLMKCIVVFSFWGASPPDPLTRGSAPGPRWGHSPQTPIIGSPYRARHSTPPNAKTKLRLWILNKLQLSMTLSENHVHKRKRSSEFTHSQQNHGVRRLEYISISHNFFYQNEELYTIVNISTVHMWQSTRKAAELMKLVTYCSNMNAYCANLSCTHPHTHYKN